MSTIAQEMFIEAMIVSKPHLAEIGFSHSSTKRNGYATYITFKSGENIEALFMYGPSDWEVELTLMKNGKHFEFKDLLQIPSIAQWTKDNKFKPQTSDRITEEVNWFIELLHFIIRNHILKD